MTPSVQESLENRFKQHPIPIKPSAVFISRIAVSTSVFKTWTKEKQEARFIRSELSVCNLLNGLFGEPWTQATRLRPFI